MKKLFVIIPVFLLLSACLDDEERIVPNYTYMADKPVEVEYDNTILYVYPKDINSGTTSWCKYPYSGNFGATSLTNGQPNTDSIVAEFESGSYAAYKCDTMTAYGYDDWYLPSKDELNAIYQQKDTLGSFVSDTYWSSTEFDEENVWVQDFSDGTQAQDAKSTYNYFRCVRRD
ncbi:MAG: DUF1566 domain-containing protein [Bacteroidota bacterium]|nr:DUF1566 domain-containing protein [Bacteroidota bacterium]